MTILFLVGVLGVLHTPGVAQIEPQCNQARINAKGVAGASLTVSTTPVTIADANTSRCSLVIVNESVNPMRCAPATGAYALTPSATVGAYIPIPASAPTQILYGAPQAWQCIRSGGADAIITVIEALP